MFSATIKAVDNGYVVQIEKVNFLDKKQEVKVFICKDIDEAFKYIKDNE